MNTALCWSYVQSWKFIQHVWKLNLNVFWQEGSRPVYFGYMSAFPALLNVTIFIFIHQILVIQYTRTKHWFLYTVYHFSRYCVWIKLSPDFRPVRLETVWSQTPSETPPWNCPWPTHLSFKHFVFVANSDLGFCVWGADFEVTSVTGYR